MNEDFYEQCLNEPFDEEYNRMAYKIGKEYHDTCEAYDQTVCQHKNERGVAIPTTGYELGLVGKNARMVMKDISVRYRISPEDVHRFVRDYYG